MQGALLGLQDPGVAGKNMQKRIQPLLPA
jgi:hypothetical protein